MPPTPNNRAIDLVLDAQRTQATQAAITQLDMDMLCAYWARRPLFLAESRQHIRPELFDPVREAHYQLLFSVLCDLQDRKIDVTLLSVLQAVHDRMAQHGAMLLTPQQQADLLRQDDHGIVYMVFVTIQDSFMSLSHARALLQKFLQERAIANPLRRLLAQGTNGAYLTALPAVLEFASNQASRLQGIARPLPTPLMPLPGAVLTPPSVFEQTGIGFVDKPLGGQRQGDSNAIVGPFGGGKSTLASQFICSAARLEYADAYLHNRTPRYSVLFTYEEPREKAWPRLVSMATKIRRDKLEALSDWSMLTTQQNMEQYERSLTQTAGQQLSESERYQANMPWVNTCIRVFDMSGSGSENNGGSGGIAEIAACLQRLVDETGCGIRTVVIDYAEIACRRYMSARNWPEERLRHLLTSWGDEVRMQISERFRCATWSLQQATGEANKYPPWKLLTIADIKECRAFAENLAVCGCIGVEDPTTGCRYINWAKMRYRPKTSAPPSLVKVHPQWAELIDVSDRYQLDEIGRRFEERTQMRRLQGGDALLSAPQQGLALTPVGT